jgi:hypothetical protein
MRSNSKSQNGDGLDRKQTMIQDVENIDKEFLSITDLADMEPDFFTNAMEKFDLLTFDAF